MPYMSQKLINWAVDTMGDLLREWKRLKDENDSLKREIQQLKGKIMHYRNGREAKNGDVIIQVGFDGKINALGVLYNATPGNDYCNGNIAPVQTIPAGACMCDCLHVEDVMAMLAEKGLDKRPEGK